MGNSVQLGDFPVNIAVHPDSRFAAILHCGYGQHEIVVVDLSSALVVARTPVSEAFYGLEFSPDGRRLYSSGAGEEVVYEFGFSDGKLTEARKIALRDPSFKGVPSGLALDSKGQTLFVANLLNSLVTRVHLASGEIEVFPLRPDAGASSRAPVSPSSDFDTAAAEKRAEASLYPNDPDAQYPYDCVYDAGSHRLYVSLWNQGAVAVVNSDTGTVLGHWAAGQHPSELALRKDGRYLFVSNGNDNTVTVFDTKDGRVVETLWATLFPNAPRGATPNSLSLSVDEDLLFVANANINAVAVFNVEQPGKSRSLGFIPTGWYPTSVRVTPDGKKLLIANGKGLEPKANPGGPQPAPNSSNDEYIGRLFSGTLSIIDLPPEKTLQQELTGWTGDVLASTPLRPDSSVSVARPAGNPIPGSPGEPSPIRYCIYILKENRTYDQVLGDMPEGNGDPSLCLFPERVTPNHHKLARDFVLLDNFYVESEVSADGHEWSMAAYATDFVERAWPMSYGHNRSGKFPYPSEGKFDIALPSSGYLWDLARAAGVSYRSYGEFVQNGPTPEAPATSKLEALQGHFDPWFRSFDLNYPDIKRAERFITELKRFEDEGDMPRLQIVRLPNDHTHGVTAGTLTPTAYVADNDLALGMVVEAVSQSKFWDRTAIFVVEDDAQNGPDHVDAHRTVAFVVSPYAQRGVVDSTLYSTTSMLRTMELVLGLPPMTQFDAAAAPMYGAFQEKPDLRPFKAAPVEVDRTETNSAAAWGQELEFNFAKEDAADDLLFNEVIWRAVRGADQPMPAPVRAGFVMARSEDEDED